MNPIPPIAAGERRPITHYYNEFDPRAAAWLRELMVDGLIPTGNVDERSITEVTGNDLIGYEQCHLFAGISGWTEALRLAGWTGPVWTGSCPCPPFSAAGKKKHCPECHCREVIPHPLKTGIFACVECGYEWLADNRHLWPEFLRLIRERRPSVVFGEQVSGPDGLVWLAGVRATLEAIGYGVGCADLCAACVGAPHIRQRLFWVAYAGYDVQPGSRQGRRVEEAERGESGIDPESRSMDGGLADTNGRNGGYGYEQRSGEYQRQQEDGVVDGLADPARRGLGIDWGTSGNAGHADERGAIDGLDNANRQRLKERTKRNGGTKEPGQHAPFRPDAMRSGDIDRMGDSIDSAGERFGRHGVQVLPVATAIQHRIASAGPWSQSRLIECRDGKIRRIPLESSFQPLVDGIQPGRVGILRGAGNAINPYVAAQFIGAFIESVGQAEGVTSSLSPSPVYSAHTVSALSATPGERNPQ